jgi:polyisoprenoid-binding protein YceI
MARYDAYNSECLLFSFKDATFDPSSIQVVCAQIDGRDDPSTLSRGDKKKIYDNVTKDVLRSRKHPEIRFDSTNVVERGEGFAVEGTLQMYGKSRNIQTSVRSDRGRWLAEVNIHQPDFGIKPYTAALGALKVKPDVLVRVSVPRES